MKRGKHNKKEMLACQPMSLSIPTAPRSTRLVVDLLLVDRRLLFVVLAPDDVVLLVKVGALVGDRENFAGVADCLSADSTLR